MYWLKVEPSVPIIWRTGPPGIQTEVRGHGVKGGEDSRVCEREGDWARQGEVEAAVQANSCAPQQSCSCLCCPPSQDSAVNPCC